MGLFDSVYVADPRTQGLLAAGAAMMSGPSRLPVSLGQSIGQGYMAGNQAYQQAMQLEAQRKQQEEQAKMRDLQLQEFKAKADELARQREEADWMRNTAAQFAKAGPDGQTTFDSEGFLNVLATRNPLQAADLRKKMIPERKTSVVGSGATLVDDKGTPIFTAPEKPEKAPAKPSAIQEYEYAVGQGYKGTFDQWDTARKKAGASSLSVAYGAPVAGVDAKGNPVFFQPSRSGGQPAIIPGVAPPAQKLGEKQANQVTGINQLSLAVDNYVSALNDYKLSDSLDIDKRAAIGNAYNNMMLTAKEAYNLGVLNGPDYDILQKVVRDPTTVMGTLTSNEALKKQAMDLKREMNKMKATIDGRGGAAPGAAADPLGLRR